MAILRRPARKTVIAIGPTLPAPQRQRTPGAADERQQGEQPLRRRRTVGSEQLQYRSHADLLVSSKSPCTNVRTERLFAAVKQNARSLSTAETYRCLTSVANARTMSAWRSRSSPAV